MARRAGALVAIVAVVVLSLFLMWRVWLHHESTAPDEEQSLVRIEAHAA